MQLGKLEAINFMSIKSATIDFQNQGLVLIQGVNEDSDAFESNGAGKSTLFSEAPTWCIYGETIRGIKGDEVINDTAKKNTSVSLEIIDDNGEVYTIIRHRKHTKHKNHVHLYKDGVNITAKSDKDTDQMIVDLLEMDFLTFTNSIMFGQGITKMFASSTDKEQKSILEKMLQIDIYKHCQEHANNQLKEFEKDYLDYETKQTTLRTMKQIREDSLDSLQKKEAELEEKCDAAIKELLSDLEANSTKLEKAQDELNSGDLQAELNNLESLVQKVEARLEEFTPVRDELTVQKSNLLHYESKARNIIRDLAASEKKLEDLKSGKNIPKTCDSCGQSLPLNDTSHLENHLEENMKNLREELLVIEEMRSEKAEVVTKLENDLSRMPALQKQLSILKEQCTDVKMQIRDLENSIGRLEKDIKRIQADINKQEELKDSTFTDSIELEIEAIDKINADMSSNHKAMTELSELIDNYKFWVEGYGNSGIKSILLDSVVPFLNTRANEYLGTLADSSIEVKFNTQELVKTTGKYRDKFSVQVSNRNGTDNYKANSGGERRRIDIAINMSLQDLVLSRSSKSLDLILYDEVFDALDELGCHKVIELLERKAKEVGTIYVITHNDALKQMFSQSVTISKTNGEASLLHE